MVYLERGWHVSPIHNQVYFAFSLDAGEPRNEYAAKDPDATNVEMQNTQLSRVLMEARYWRQWEPYSPFPILILIKGIDLARSLCKELCKKALCFQNLLSSLWLPCEVGPMIISIFHMRPLRLIWKVSYFLPRSYSYQVAQWRFETGN